jgi:hypothetical protein
VSQKPGHPGEERKRMITMFCVRPGHVGQKPGHPGEERKRMITAKEIIKQLKTALKKFGEYSLLDKGPSEVMMVNPIVAELRKMSAEDAGIILKEVAGLHEHGQFLANHLVSCLDDMPEDWFNEILRISGAEC